jgi:hypothetical protein
VRGVGGRTQSDQSATFDPADARPLVSAILGRGQFQDDGQFSSYQLPPGRYYARINNPPGGWKLTAAMWNGQDISNNPVLVKAVAPRVAIMNNGGRKGGAVPTFQTLHAQAGPEEDLWQLHFATAAGPRATPKQS